MKTYAVSIGVTMYPIADSLDEAREKAMEDIKNLIDEKPLYFKKHMYVVNASELVTPKKF